MLQQIDAKTLALVSNSVGSCVTLLAILLWLNGKMYPGFGRWTLARIMVFFSIMFSIQIGVWPDWLTVLAADALGICNVTLTLEALREFDGMRPQIRWIYAAGACLFLLLVYFTLFQLSHRANYVAILLAIGAIHLACAGTVFRPPDWQRQTGRFITGIGFCVAAAAYIVRASYYTLHAGGAMVDPDPWGKVTLMVVMLSTVALNFGFFLMHYERLVTDRDEEVALTGRARAELTQLKESLEDTVNKRTVELRENEAKFRSYIENAPLTVLVMDREGRVLDCNLAAAGLTGYESAALAGMNFADLLSEEQRAAFLGNVSAWLERVNSECSIRRRDGTAAGVWLYCVKLASEQWLVYIADQTERLKLEAQVLQSQKMDSIGRLAGGLAHDFNNLLTVINGNSDLALARLPESDSNRRRVEQIRKAGGLAAGLTQQLLAFSRKQLIQAKPLNLNTLLREAEKLLSRVLPENIGLETRLDPKLGLIVADSGQIHQVLMNLALNARDAMPGGGTIVMETENVDLDQRDAAEHPEAVPGPHVELRVGDNGTGMNESVREHVFEPFFTTRAEKGGTGLGLASVYGIVRQSGGWIRVYSKPGKGTTFKIYLPRTGVCERLEQSEAASSVPCRGTETVLVVEDQPDVRAWIKEVLESYGYNVLEAGAGPAALELSGKYAPAIDLLLTDVVMPGMTGKELSERFRSPRPGMRVLYMSGYPEQVIDRQGVFKAGIAYVSKPLSADTLVAKVRETLGRPSVPA